MSKLTSRGYTAQDATDFMARTLEPHTLQWKASSVLYSGGNVVSLAEELPIVSGTLALDSSDPHRRQLSLEVGGLDQFVADAPNDPLVPFGQILNLWCRIDRRDGSWFPWLKQGEFPINTYTYETPAEVITVDCMDYSARVDEFLHLTREGYGKQTVRGAVVEIVNDAIPDKLFNVNASAAAGTVKLVNYVAEAGQGRWDAAVELCTTKGFECFFDAAGNLVIRKDLTDDNDEALPENGPDIGTVTSPVAVIADGPTGNLVALTATVTRQGAVNAVQVNLNATVAQKGNKPDIDVTRSRTASVETGSIAWGDRFGRMPFVKERNVKKITAALLNDAQSDAKRLLHRRRGVIRYLDLDAAGLYWVEPDDKIRVSYGGMVENHYVQRVEFDLTGQAPARLRTRQLAVTDPGPTPTAMVPLEYGGDLDEQAAGGVAAS